MKGKDVVAITTSKKLTAKVIAAHPQLKAICNVAVGYNNIDVAAATQACVSELEHYDIARFRVKYLNFPQPQTQSKDYVHQIRQMDTPHGGAARHDRTVRTGTGAPF